MKIGNKVDIQHYSADKVLVKTYKADCSHLNGL